MKEYYFRNKCTGKLYTYDDAVEIHLEAIGGDYNNPRYFDFEEMFEETDIEVENE